VCFGVGILVGGLWDEEVEERHDSFGANDSSEVI
jgi:hypothetical protein